MRIKEKKGIARLRNQKEIEHTSLLYNVGLESES